MSGPAQDRFQRALEKFRRSLSVRDPSLLHQFSLGSLQDLETACTDIQTEMGGKGSLCRMSRIKRFVEAMEELGKSIEVFVNANDLVCFIWVAKTHFESFDKLLDAYEKVGQRIPCLLEYGSMLEKQAPLATVLEDYYSDILRFHEAALKVFIRPKWKKLFKAAWKTFDTEFQPLLQSLENRRELLDSMQVTASLYEITKTREEMTARENVKKQELRQNENEKHKWRLLQIRAQLEAADYQEDQEIATDLRDMTNSGDWVLQSPDFKHWVDKTATRHGVLYLSGIPGAGKTTLMSSIIAHLLDENNNNNDGNQATLTAYFYIKHKQPRKDTHNSLLRAMMEQIVSRDPILSDHLFDKLASVEGTQLRSTKYLEPLISTALETYQRAFILIDGLDEASTGEAAKSLKWLLSLVSKGPNEPTTSVRILCSGRRDGVLDKLLSDSPEICLESDPAHKTDIWKYCEHMGAEIRQKLDIAPTMEQEIVSKVANQADGMFLYARVVLNNLLGQTTLYDLRQELQPDTFPEEMDQAYERVAIRVLKDAPTNARHCASKILGWVTCAARPLFWREIQAIFCINVESAILEYEEKRLRVSCKELCGSLVDVHQVLRGRSGPDDIVTIVHGSARKYLLQNSWINGALEHAKAATFCFQYLTSKPFCGDGLSIPQHAIQGYYGFQDYAVKYCLDHFESYIRLRSSEDLMPQQTKDSAINFLEIHSLPGHCDLADLSPSEIIDFFIQLPSNNRERTSKFSIGYRTMDLRSKIEQLRAGNLSPGEKASISNFYGNKVTYKCPKVWCDYFSMGFDSNEDRQKHVDSHDRPFRCPEGGCFAFKLGYSRQSDLEEHTDKYHRTLSEMPQFPKAKRPRHNDTLLDAAGRNDLDAMLAFLESGALVHGSPVHHRTHIENRIPIGRASKNGHVEACKLLLERGANLRYGRKDTLDCVSLTIEHKHLDLLRGLLSWPQVEISKVHLASLITQACTLAQPDTVQVLFGSSNFRSYDIDTWTGYAPKWAFAACDKSVDDPDSISIVQFLLENGFSYCFESDLLLEVKNRGGEYMASLLQPIIDRANQHYQMQLMLLEAQNKKRLMMARQEYH